MIYDEIAMNAACMFENSVTILNRKMNEGIIKLTTNNDKNGYLDASLFVPIVVNCSFACELYIKSMIPNKINLHKLDDLFFKLDNNIQQQVQNNVITKMQESLTNYNDKDFKNDLQQNNNIFVEWRYFFEGNSKSVNYPFLFKLMETLREVAISIR